MGRTHISDDFPFMGRDPRPTLECSCPARQTHAGVLMRSTANSRRSAHAQHGKTTLECSCAARQHQLLQTGNNLLPIWTSSRPYSFTSVALRIISMAPWRQRVNLLNTSVVPFERCSTVDNFHGTLETYGNHAEHMCETPRSFSKIMSCTVREQAIVENTFISELLHSMAPAGDPSVFFRT